MSRNATLSFTWMDRAKEGGVFELSSSHVISRIVSRLQKHNQKEKNIHGWLFFVSREVFRCHKDSFGHLGRLKET